MGTIYFKGLNGIRAIACMVVIVFHIDQFLNLFDLPKLGYHTSGMAAYGVTLFFVLSGYLITFLMLTEKEMFGKVELVNFYKRRILRIWPIYYLVIIVAILLLSFNIISSHSNAITGIALYSLLLSNVGYAFGYHITPITPLWSVGVEEQFYAFWPLLLNKSKNIFMALIIVIIIYLLLKVGLRFFENGPWYSLITNTAFDSMAIGGLVASLVFYKSRLLSYLYNPLLQILCWLFLGISVFYKPIHFLSLFDSEMHSVIYAIIIVNVSTNEKSLISLENNVFNFIGKISYGMYVYHMLIIVLLSYYFKIHLHAIPSHTTQYVVVYTVIIGVTIIVSYLSYNYFESFFLKLKTSFSKVRSTNTKGE